MRLLNAFVGCIAVVLTTGCGSGLYPVEGVVMWKDGAPATELAGSNVVFDNVESSAIGNIQVDATFKLTTNNPNDGAPAGEYKVLVIEVGRQTLPNSDLLAPGVLDPRFSDSARSELTATVKPGENKITLTVERNPEK